MKKLSLFLVAVLLASFALSIKPMPVHAFDPNSIMDDGVFEDYNSMSASQIDAFLNGFSSSCISSNNGFTTTDPQGWSTSQNKYVFGGNVSGGKALYDTAQLYHVNPRVILATLQKEQSIVTGAKGCHYDRPNPADSSQLYTCTIGGQSTTCTDACPNSYGGGCMNIALGYNCPGSCKASSEGFSMQLTLGTWLLRFGQQRSYGTLTGYAGYESGDEYFTYYGPMTPGSRQRTHGGAFAPYDGTYTTASPESIGLHITNGATATLYNFTPFVSGNTNFYNIFTAWFGSLYSCDYPKGSSPPPANIYHNAGAATIPGNWTSTTGQGFAYATPNHSGGFDVAVMTPSSNGLVWQGVWWSQTNGAIGLSNTILIPAKNSDGLTDLYYATSTNWSKPGFTVGLMHNNGHGFTYAGTQWVTTSLSLANTTFIPGNWTGGSNGQGFAYATPNYSGGFDVAVMTPSSNGLVWQGVWWSQTNGSISRMNTVFVPADTDNDGLTDLYYATSINWSNPGFSVGLMHNNGTSMTWGGPQWSNSTLNLGTTTFIPGNWTGGSNGQGFAYVTACGNRGFDVSVMTPTSNGLQWRGRWWQAPTLPRSSTAFIPADQDGDGFTDLYYATPNGDYGFDVALQHNSSGGSYTWQGLQWSPTSIPLRNTMFLPSR